MSLAAIWNEGNKLVDSAKYVILGVDDFDVFKEEKSFQMIKSGWLTIFETKIKETQTFQEYR